MTKAELVDHVAATVHLPKHQIDAVLTQCLQGIMDALGAGDTVELRGFGRFHGRRSRTSCSLGSLCGGCSRSFIE